MNNNTLVFPNMVEGNGKNLHADGGLTKRELFAAMAMQGIVSKVPYLTQTVAESKIEKRAEIIARGAIMYADSLIAELEKKK